MEKDDGEAHASAGQDCPARESSFGATSEITINGERLQFILATDEEGAAITQCLKERAESAPAGARIGRASALFRSGLRVAAIILLVAGVGVGLGDGNVFDDVGCSVAQQPRRTSHDADSGQARVDGSVPDGPSVGDEDGGLTIEDGGEWKSQEPPHPCPLPQGRRGSEITTTDLPAKILQALLFQRDLLDDLIRGQEKLLMAAPQATEPGLADGKKRPEKRILHTMGNFEYLTGFEDVWLNRQHYNLRAHKKARLCLEYLVTNHAMDAATARHFLDEIDPYVRETGDFILLQNIRIKDYFNDPDGRLQKLRQALVQPVGGNGKYYLQTGASCAD